MIGDVVRKAGEGVGDAVAGPTEGLMDSALAFLLSPWGLLVLGGIFLAIRAIR